jgi:hypothetical protein
MYARKGDNAQCRMSRFEVNGVIYATNGVKQPHGTSNRAFQRNKITVNGAEEEFSG